MWYWKRFVAKCNYNYYVITVIFRWYSVLLQWYSVLLRWYFVSRIFVKRNLSPGLLRWSILQTKEGQRHTEFHLVGFENSQTPSTTTVWPSDHREDYRPIVLGPCTALYRPFLKHCTLWLTRRLGLYHMTGLVQTSSEATRSWSSSPLIVSQDSFSHQTWARFQPGGA